MAVRDRPTVRQLECLVAVARERTFRAAARALHLSQPALSAQVRNAEQLLGVQVFERGPGRGVLLTAPGRRVVDRARELLTDLDDLAGLAAGAGDGLAGPLGLGVIPTLAPYVLPRALPPLRTRWPTLRPRLREARTADLLADLGAGDLDLLLLAIDVPLGKVETLHLFDDPFLLAVRDDDPLADRAGVEIDDLRDREMLLLEEGHCLRDQTLELCQRAGAREGGDFRGASLATLLHMVASGIGCTLVPACALDWERRRELSLRFVPLHGAHREIGLAWRPGTARARAFTELGAFLEERVAAF